MAGFKNLFTSTNDSEGVEHQPITPKYNYCFDLTPGNCFTVVKNNPLKKLIKSSKTFLKNK